MVSADRRNEGWQLEDWSRRLRLTDRLTVERGQVGEDQLRTTQGMPGIVRGDVALAPFTYADDMQTYGPAEAVPASKAWKAARGRPCVAKVDGTLVKLPVALRADLWPTTGTRRRAVGWRSPRRRGREGGRCSTG